MKVDAKIKYNEEYLPTRRHRKFRIREAEAVVQVELKEIKADDIKLAFLVTDYRSYLDEKGVNQFGPGQKEIYAFDGELYSLRKDMQGALDRGEYTLDSLLEELDDFGRYRFHHADPKENTRDYVEDLVRKVADSHILVDGKVYEKCSEPRYNITTFGLGHNHGGTGMFIEYGYNSNISKENYFNALQREEAIAYANKVAERRGDTKDIGKFGDVKNIEVFMPEMVKCDPQKEHGDGNPFINSLEGLISGSDNTLEAGLLVMAATSVEIKEPKGSLEEKISGAKEKTVPRNGPGEAKDREK